MLSKVQSSSQVLTATTATTATMAGGAETSAVIMEMVSKDKKPWYKKKNLRNLYFWLIPFAMFIESTSGFDSSMMNVSCPTISTAHTDFPGSPSSLLLEGGLQPSKGCHSGFLGFRLQSWCYHRHSFRPACVRLGWSSLVGRLRLSCYGHRCDFAGSFPEQ